MRLLIKVKPTTDRLDHWLLKEIKNTSRNQIRKLIDSAAILVNSHPVDPDYHLKKNDKVDINLPPPPATAVTAENISLKIIYEDPDVVVVDKPVGLVVHPTSGHPHGTLVNALLFHWGKLPGVGENLRPGIVHRLDKDTSGLIVVAKTGSALENLKTQFAGRKVKKTYLAIVAGSMTPKEGLIKANIARHPKNPMKFIVDPLGKEAETKYKVLKESKKYSYLELSPLTGRTHQLRVHLSALKHPIVGDRLYGGQRVGAGQLLHATSLEFVSPGTGELLKFSAPLPPEFTKILDKLIP